MRWRPGEVVALRHLNGGRVSFVWPMIVVEDSDEGVALFIRTGTPTLRRVQLDGTAIPRRLGYADRNRLPWRLGDGDWYGSSVVQLARPGEPRAYWAFYDQRSGRLKSWYVNLQAPLTRTAIGFDTSDHVLDLVIAADLSSWRWKDEDELEEAVELGRFTPAEAARIRRDGEEAIAALHRREWPFDGGWDRWRPDPAWPVPELPEGWDAPG